MKILISKIRMLKIAVLIPGTLLFGAACSSVAADDEELPVSQEQQLATVSFTLALPIPAVLAPTSTDSTTDYYNLTIKTGSVQMRSTGAKTPVVGFNGTFPGPTVVATKGRKVKVTQSNGWNENITIHNHGHKVAASSDGHPVDYVVPGASKTYDYPNDQAAGSFWYHDHTMDLTGDHVYRGIAAFYLIKDPAEDALKLPAGEFDVPLMIQDKSFNADNTLLYRGEQRGTGALGDIAVINGAETPYLSVKARKYRFRVLNAANARSFKIALSNNASFKIIGSDGGLLSAPVTVTSLVVSPAERYDIVVDFSSYAVGTKLQLKNSSVSGRPASVEPVIDQLMEFRVIANPSADTSQVPATLKTITRWTASQAAATVPIGLNIDNGDWEISGLTYDPNRIDVTSTLNKVYIWEITNQSGEMHPFHKHLVEFNVLDINGVAPSAEQAGWKDTIGVPANGGKVRIIFKNETFKGTYVFHCHILEHEDHRMMAQEAVN
jgi:spore coat protein A, manganese oxidase